jgi:hypothetical protein
MYSLDCSYYKAEFETIDELIEAATINGMDPNYEITTHPSPLHAFFIPFQKYIQNIAKKR